jgi:hypothetical protein
VRRLLFAVLSVGLLSDQETAAQPTRDSIQGVWRVMEATITGPGARTIAFAERPNMTIITARHYSRVEVQADGPRPVLADVAKASADELRAVWGPFVGEAGTYEVIPGGFITMRPIASKNPAVMGPGVFITYAYKLDGDTLSLTQQRNQNGLFANPFTLKLVREGVLIAAAGVAIGTPAAYATSRTFAALLFGVKPTACSPTQRRRLASWSSRSSPSYGPARHAAGVDRIVALRAE